MNPLRIAFALESGEDLRLLLPVADALAGSNHREEGEAPERSREIAVVLAGVGAGARERLQAEGRPHEIPPDSDWFFTGQPFDLIVMPLVPAERGGLFHYLARDASRRGIPVLAVERDPGRPAFARFPGYLALAGGASYSQALHLGWDPARVAVTGSPLFDGARGPLARRGGAPAAARRATLLDEEAFWAAELAGVARPLRVLVVSAFPFAPLHDRSAFSEGLVSGLASVDGVRIGIAASIGGRDLSESVAALASRLGKAGLEARIVPADSWHDRVPEADVLLSEDLSAGLHALAHGIPFLAIEWPLPPMAPGEAVAPLCAPAALRLPEGMLVAPEWAGGALREALAGGRAPAALAAGSALERVRGFVEMGPPPASERIGSLALHLASARRARHDEAHERVLSGNARLGAGNAREAEAAYREALDGDPSNRAALTNLGLVLAARGADGDALDCFSRVLDADPRNITVRLAAARVLAQAGDPFAGIRLLEEIVSAPPDRRVLIALADLYLQAGVPGQAIEFLDAAGGIAPPDDNERAARARAASLAGLPESGASPQAPAPAGPAAAAAKTSIVIVTMNELPYTKKCVASIAANTPEPHEIVFVDNGSTDGTADWLDTVPNARVIRNAKNFGFAAAANQGIRAAAGQRVLLLNNDAVVTAGWLAGLLRHLDRDPRIGLVGPVSNYVSGPQLDPTARYEALVEMEDHARRTARERRGQFEETRRLVGFCLLARAELFHQIGLFDERFGLGNFEDDDLCVRAVLAGWRLVIAKDVFIHHFGSRTFLGNRINYREALDRNKAYFLEKWRGVVAGSNHPSPLGA